MLDELGLSLVFDHAGSAHKDARHFSELDTSVADGFNRILLLTRDPRDTVVSGFHQATVRRSYFHGSIGDFLRDPRHGIHKAVHFGEIWARRAAGDDRFHTVSYEGLLREPCAKLEAVATFLGAGCTFETIKAVVEANSFEKMRAKERRGDYVERYGGRFGSDKVRRGVVGGYRDELGPDDIAYCDAVISRNRLRGGRASAGRQAAQNCE